MKIIGALAAAVCLAFHSVPALAQGEGVAERLYVIACGQGHAPDQSRWSPGVNVGKPLDMVTNCFLIRHPQGFLLWETGVGDTFASIQEGRVGTNGAPSWTLARSLLSQLAEIGVRPNDIRYVAVSHTHNDHIGNVELFPHATLLVQKAEYEWPNPLSKIGRFKPEHPVIKLEGDRDVFGDGSVMLFSTPGHTPGHQSIMVRLEHTGTILISGDAVHFKDNWDNRRVPSFNYDKAKSLASMQRIADLLVKYRAQLWIHHDKAQYDKEKHAPDFYD